MSDSEDLIQRRDSVIRQLRKDLFGPADGENEFVVGKPAWRYLTGILFPSDPTQVLEDEQDEHDPSTVSDADDESDSAISAAYDLLPASMGISFYIEDAKELTFEVEGARYMPVDVEELKQQLRSGAADDAEVDRVREVLARIGIEEEDSGNESDSDQGSDAKSVSRGHGDIWKRHVLGSREVPSTARVSVPKKHKSASGQSSVLGESAEILVRFRPLFSGHLVTATLVNRLVPSSKKGAAGEVAAMLFQCRFNVRLASGGIRIYPRLDRFSRHPEDDELAFVYRDRATFGIGHGCSAIWDVPLPNGDLRLIAADTLPSFEVRGLTNRIAVSPEARVALDIRWLAEPSRSTKDLKKALDAFAGSYEAWVNEQMEQVQPLEGSTLEVANRLIERQRLALARIRRGISCLVEGDEIVRDSFRTAQEAMLRQFAWIDHRRGGPFDVGEARDGRIDPMNEPPSELTPKWYPFQLAFQLLVLESLVDPDSRDRDAVDLLWFPTGGGKTEAYLALAAFEMIHRRLRYNDSGTAVLMRYTLRLLTSQQFERCATLVSALETMRREQTDVLGTEPFRLGLWVGGQLTPNHLDCDSDRSPGAKQLVEQILDDERPENPFVLRTCPRCGTRLVPTQRSARAEDYGVSANASQFKLNCPDERCELHDEIPASVVDEDLMINPPTFLIGTIDKFARMVWDARSRVFLGRGQAASLPPTLVIQDELHLINGPMGSVAGVYEAGIETVIQHGGVVPKYIASTATIQRASEQCSALYAREPFIFPPSGLDASDSFFSKEDNATPGRTYLGVMGNGLYSSLTTLVQVSSAAAHAPTVIPASDDVSRDTYWTQVIYHNSKQELGKTTTMLRDDVLTRLAILQPSAFDRRPFDSVEELSANLKGAAVSEALERLQVGYPADGVIDAVACTNMISVGVDVGRLGLMIVKGQPKSTAEYIQATSRVGRQRERPPGIVITMYSPLRPRDRSHFESFQSYHQSLYRAVEPSSVTPFSAPARQRTLHAGLVLALRHVMAWTEGRDAGKFDLEDAAQTDLIREYRERLLAACKGDERAEVEQHLDSILEEWSREVTRAGRRPLTFDPKKQFRSLLTRFPRSEGPEGVWPTLNSMRHVDGETPFEIRGQYDIQSDGRRSRD